VMPSLLTKSTWSDEVDNDYPQSKSVMCLSSIQGGGAGDFWFFCPSEKLRQNAAISLRIPRAVVPTVVSRRFLTTVGSVTFLIKEKPRTVSVVQRRFEPTPRSDRNRNTFLFIIRDKVRLLIFILSYAAVL
jgi:hypothetical protein